MHFEQYLAADEEVKGIWLHHWIVVAKAGALGIAGLVLALWIGVWEDPVAGLVMATAPAGWLAYHLLRWRHFDVVVVTTARVVTVEGIVARRTRGVPIWRVTDTDFRQSILGRILGYADFVLDVPGQDPGLPILTRIARPHAFYSQVMAIATAKAPA